MLLSLPVKDQRIEVPPAVEPFPSVPVTALSTAGPMIQVNKLPKLYGDFVAVNELSFSVQAGEVLGLVGSNGAGKTTTLRCLSWIIPPTRGTIRICGHDLVRDPIAA